MLRALLLILLLAVNAILGAYQLGWIDPWPGLVHATGRETQRIAQQLQPETLRVVKSSVSGTSAAAEVPQPPAAITLPVTTDNPASSAAITPAIGAESREPTPANAEAQICLDVGPFPGTEAAQKKTLLLALLPAGQGRVQTLSIDKRWWIHLPPAPTRAAAERQVAQLRAAGVTEYVLMNNEGAPGATVSLGLFNDRDRATRLMEMAQRKGLTPNLTERPNGRSRVVYRIASISPAMADRIHHLARQQWTPQTVRACPSPASSPPTAQGRPSTPVSSPKTEGASPA